MRARKSFQIPQKPSIGTGIPTRNLLSSLVFSGSNQRHIFVVGKYGYSQAVPPYQESRHRSLETMLFRNEIENQFFSLFTIDSTCIDDEVIMDRIIMEFMT